MVRSMAWGYARIIAGTIAGGGVGFYVMHRLEISYKEKWDERLRKYEEELNKKKQKSEFEEAL
ncbi:hypothetical protein Ccrd_019112 [Cynara cardunculus var. scolymus]|uniref:Uncharacterized protein n=1 Tax=Cynara cardunculus var. scolymus TaxID=59895 RepID=A0A103Y4Y3_CYNCS|nr:hypothetical protein Ccrd_019112 [Cynara cardunculus var. scolymus]